MKLRSLALVLTIATPFAAQAHRPWLLPSDTVMAPKSTVTVDAAVSTDLFAFDHNPLRVETLVVTAPDASALATPAAHTGRLRSGFDLELAQPGTYRVAVVNAGLSASWEENGEPKRWRGTRDAFFADVPQGAQKLQVTQGAMRVETFLTAGPPNATALTPTGVGLELAPVTHPNDLYAGETATFGLLIDGKPAAGVEGLVIADGTRFRNAQEEMKFVTDIRGQFRVTFPKAGWYWLNATLQDTRNLQAPATQRRASYAVTLEVQPQ